MMINSAMCNGVVHESMVKNHDCYYTCSLKINWIFELQAHGCLKIDPAYCVQIIIFKLINTNL
jgi:hypothetical protein